MPCIALQGEPQGQTLLVKFLMLQGQMAQHGFSVATKLPQSPEEECKPPAGSSAWAHPCLNCARCSLAHLKHARDLTLQLCSVT